MRRGLLLAAGAALLVTLALWLAAKVERSPLTRSNGDKRVPAVVAGRDLAAREAPVRRDDGGATIRCSYDGTGAAGRLVAMGDEVVEGSEGGRDLNLRVPPGTWSIVWQTADDRALALGSVVVEGGEVYTCDLGARGWEVRGTVRSLDGQPLSGVDVNVCGEPAETDQGGQFRAHARQRTCAVRAVYRDGILARPSETVTVGPFDARAVELSVDDSPIAGIGVAFRMTRAGARVLQVHALTPAEEAGVEPGDVIVAVDGTSAVGLSDEEFIALGTGREGSRVELELERRGERFTVRFARERLERIEDTG